MLSEKGKYATATENRRFVWGEIIWPLILEINDVVFSLKQFQNKRQRVCNEKNIPIQIGIDGIILSKADVDEKGGAAISVSYITQKPILYLGVGQEYKDLKEFNSEDIIKAIGL